MSEQKQRRYQHSAVELIRAGFWLSVGALIVFPVVMIVVGLVLAAILSGS